MGRWVKGEGGSSWNVFGPLHKQEKSAHDLRDSWRLFQMKQWKNEDRIDAQVARQERLSIDMPLLQRLRKVARQVDGHAIGVMTGGVSTDARWCPRFRAGLRDRCFSCDLDHVMWFCPAFQNARPSRPASLFARRLGWSGEPESVAVTAGRLQKVGLIRELEVQGRNHRASWV